MSTDAIVVTPAAGADRSRVKKLLAVGAVVFVATILVPRLTGGGGGITEENFPVVAAPAPAPAPAPQVGTVRLAGATRDPFRALVTPAVDTAAPSPGAGTPAPAPVVEGFSEPLPVFPVTEPVPEPTPTTVAPAPAPAPAPTPTTTTTVVDARDLRTFSLYAVKVSGGKKTARIGIDDAVLEVVEGERFWLDYTVVSLDTEAMCGVFDFRGKAFALCHGETTRT